MRIITRKKLVDFSIIHSGAKTALDRWYFDVSNSMWESHADIKTMYPNADYIGNQRYVFNIHGNKYRLVVVVQFTHETVYIRFVGTHDEYNKIDCKTI